MRKTANVKRKVPVNVVGSNTFGIQDKISASATYNLFISDNWMVNTPGYQRILNLLPNGEGEGRDLFTCIRGNFLLAVVGANVYTISSNFSVTFIGALATATGEVFIDENLNSQICIVDGINAYIYNYTLPPNLTIQTGLGTLIPGYVEYHNAQFLFGNANTTPGAGSAWYSFVFNSPTTIIANPVASQFAIQTKPDFALAVVRLPGQGNNVLALGKTVGEIWTQVGGLENYRRNSTINIDFGVASVSTIARSDKYVAWLGINEHNSPVIVVYTGQSFGSISTDGIDKLMDSIKFPSQSTAMFFRDSGHLFYQLTFYNPVDNLSLLYDFDTEKFYYFTDNFMNYHPARNYAFFNGDTYFASLNNAALYQSSSLFTNYNENIQAIMPQDPTLNLEIPRIRIPDTFREEDSSQFRANSLVITIEQGNDLAVTGVSLLNNIDLLITESTFVPPDDVIYTEQGTPMADEDSGAGVGAGNLPPPYRPRVDLSISRDGGVIFGNTVGRGLNPVAIRQNILTWDNMGMCNEWTPQLRFWGMDRFTVSNGILEIF